jgi:hypothetical protein
VPVSVQEIDRHADDEPSAESQPGDFREGAHQVDAGQDSEDRDEWHERDPESSTSIRLAMVVPSSAGVDIFARLYRYGGGDKRNKFPMDSRFDGQDAETGFRTVESDSFREFRYGFSFSSVPRVIHDVRFVLSRSITYCIAHTQYLSDNHVI